MEAAIDKAGAARADADWQALDAELDRWHAAGRTATLWWRDDDATAPSPALEALLAMRRRHRVPLTVAVVPAVIDPALGTRLADDAIAVVQHGYAHQNHGAPDAKKIELGAERPSAHVLAELAVGQQQLSAFAGWLPVLVPPWNRIAPHLVPALPEVGFRGLSTFGQRQRARPVAGLVQANSHVDPVDWRGGRGFVGDAAALGATIAHLRARREGHADAAEPTGLMTHHLVDGDTTWAFVDDLLGRTTAHPAATWLTAAAVFDAP